MAKGHNRDKAEKHAEDYETIPLQPEGEFRVHVLALIQVIKMYIPQFVKWNATPFSDKEQLIRYKFRWADADEDPQDNQLTDEEFKSFRHPEQSPNMLKRMVQDITDNLGMASTLKFITFWQKPTNICTIILYCTTISGILYYTWTLKMYINKHKMLSEIYVFIQFNSFSLLKQHIWV